MSAVIVDDERSARRRLIRLLVAVGGVEVVGEASNGVEAVDIVRALRPDLLFLDVQMPEADGFDALRSIGEDRPPEVVFVTAFDQFAVQAFEICAVDYLLKPVECDRLEATLARAREHLARRGPSNLEERLERLERLVGGASGRQRVLGRRQSKLVPLDPARVSVFVSDDRLVFALMEGERVLVDHTLAELEERFGSFGFLRVHRQALVNIDHILSADLDPAGGMVLHLTGSHRIEVSRRQTPLIRARLEGR